MPSDAKKREQQKKKDAAKARGGKKGSNSGNPSNEQGEMNGKSTQNGYEKQLTAEGKTRSYRYNLYQSLAVILTCLHLVSELLCMKLDAEAKINSEARSCTGSLAIHPRARDIKIANFSITFYGTELLQDTLLELNCGRRYGLIGLNGSGKRYFVFSQAFYLQR